MTNLRFYLIFGGIVLFLLFGWYMSYLKEQLREEQVKSEQYKAKAETVVSYVRRESKARQINHSKTEELSFLAQVVPTDDCGVPDSDRQQYDSLYNATK